MSAAGSRHGRSPDAADERVPVLGRNRSGRMIRGIEAPELLVIAVLALVLFGGSRLPEIARSLGKSIRIFATESRPASSAAHPDEQSATDPHAGTDM